MTSLILASEWQSAIGPDLARLDPVEPVLPKVQHVVSGDVGDVLVTDYGGFVAQIG